MPYDGLVLAAVCHELNTKLAGGRIEKIYQPLKAELALLISKPQARYRLLISANASVARIHLTENNKPNPAIPPLFCMVLRKHLEGGRLRQITQQSLERILHLEVDTWDELGQPVVKTLIIEIMGKHSNIILVENLPDKNYKILDGIKRYSHAVSRHREVLPGRTYLAPPRQDKVSPLNLTEERFFALVTSADIDTKLTDILLKTFTGFSPRMCREVLYRSGLALDLPLDHCGEYELRLLWQYFSNICSDLQQGNFTPMLVYNADQSVLDFAAFNLTQYAAYQTLSGEMNPLLDRFYTQKDYQQQMQAKSQSMLTIIKRASSKLRKKLVKHQQSLATANRGDDWRIYGELLTANMYRLKQGLDQIELENLYHPEQVKITITLNPRLTPAENAQAYFKKYVKSKNTLKAVNEQLIQARQELDYLEGVETALHLAKKLSDLTEIQTELIAQAYLKPPAEKKQSHKSKKKASSRPDKPQPLVYRSDEQFNISVGKNNRQNDYLTQRLAQPDDLWLHTKEIPGSHVVIHTNGKKIPDNIIKRAAQLAAFHSKARQSSNVPVDYTYVKYVRKPKGAKPGFVIYDHQKTIIVNPSEQ